ncbi:MAG: hypothetical protein KIS66_00430 [Fimbriimonadaceae bacterium]|nr:hypothetical protein [Fimbriimonadaceae bacterium]
MSETENASAGGRNFKQSDRTRLRRKIKSMVSASPGLIASKYVNQIVEETDEFGDQKTVRREVELMIREGLLEQRSLTKSGKTYDNLHVPEYRLNGKLVSIRAMVGSRENVHGLTFDAIRYRLLEGLTPYEALKIPKTEPGKLRSATEDWRSGDDDLPF